MRIATKQLVSVLAAILLAACGSTTEITKPIDTESFTTTEPRTYRVDTIETRVEDGSLDIPCQYCATDVLIPRSIEERYRGDPSFGDKQQELAETVEKRAAAEGRPAWW